MPDPLFRFNPDMYHPETLEAIFVQREDLARDLMDATRSSATTEGKHYTLLIGPRGVGKTHLMSLIYHRIKADTELADRLVLAWLHEEQWGISSMLDLLVTVLNAIRHETGDVGLDQVIQGLYEYGTDVASAEREAGRALREYVGDRTLLVIVENLDQIFRGLGEKGQQALRAYLQTEGFVTILATSQALFGGVVQRSNPFYGFFRIIHLEQLSVAEAAELLARIARFRGDEELAAYVATPDGRARVRAVHFLAGGNHRIYVALSEFLTCESMRSLSDAFLAVLDDLTPFYQSRMQSLAPLQRKMVEVMAGIGHAAPVNEIAARCFASQQSVSRQLGELRDLRYVRSTKVGREAYYELCEPLLRLCIERKNNRGRPIALFVDFLRHWYSRDELEARIATLAQSDNGDREYLTDALRLHGMESEAWRPLPKGVGWRATRFLRLRESVRDLLAELEAMTATPHTSAMWRDLSEAALLTGQYAGAAAAMERALELEPDSAECWADYASALAAMNRWTEAISAVDRALAIDCQRPQAWLTKSYALLRSGDKCAAAQALDRALTLAEDSEVSVLSAEGPTIVEYLLLGGGSREVWRGCTEVWVAGFEDHGMLLSLVIGAVLALLPMVCLEVSADAATEWAAIWAEHAREHDELTIAAELLSAAAEWKRATTDADRQRVLLGLADEQRRLIAPLLGVDTPDDQCER